MRTENTLNLLVGALQVNCGDILAACKAVGVSLIFVNQWRKDDKQVNEALTEAERVGAQGLVSAAIQRAVRGVEEDVYFKGEVVGQKTNYSDSLLTTLLKAKIPEFAKDAEGGGVHVNVQVANLMPRANSYEEWLTMKAQTLAKPVPKLEAPDADRDQALEALGRVMCEPEFIDAEYAEVSPFKGIDL